MPRQGILPAYYASLHLGLPMTTIDMLKQGKYWASDKTDKKPGFKRALLVDDSVASGKQMEKAVRVL